MLTDMLSFWQNAFATSFPMSWLSFHKLQTPDKMPLVSEHGKLISVSNGANRAISSGNHKKNSIDWREQISVFSAWKESYTPELDLLQLSPLLHKIVVMLQLRFRSLEYFRLFLFSHKGTEVPVVFRLCFGSGSIGTTDWLPSRWLKAFNWNAGETILLFVSPICW